MSYTPPMGCIPPPPPMPIKDTKMSRLVPIPPPPRPQLTTAYVNPFRDLNTTIQQIMDLLDPEGAMARVQREQLDLLFCRPRPKTDPAECPFPAEWMARDDLQTCPLCGGMIVPGVVHLRPDGEATATPFEIAVTEDKINPFEEI